MIDTKQLEGFAELSAQLKELGEKAGGRVLRAAVTSAALPALNAIKAAAPVGDRVHKTFKGRLVAPGFLSRNLRRKTLKTQDTGRAIVLIGPLSEAFYAKFLEAGTTKMSARPFMEPMFDAANPAMIARLREQLKKGIDRVVAKTKK